MIATVASPTISITAPEWTPDNKEAGRVDALFPDDTGRCFVGGNFQHPKKYLAVSSAAGNPGTLNPSGVTGRVYDLAWDADAKTLHVAGAGGYATHAGKVWTQVETGRFRSVGLHPLFPENVFLGSDNGQVEVLGQGWVAHVAGSARDLVVTEDAVYVAVNGGSKGTIAKFDVETGTALPWASSPGIPVLDLAISPDGATIYAAIGGPGGTAAAYDAATGARKWFHMTDGNCQAICVLADGTVIVGMHGDFVASAVNKTIKESGTGGRVPRKKVFALDPDGNLLPWSVKLSSNDSPLGVWALAATPTMLWVGGDFTGVNGADQQRLTAFAIS